MATSTNKVCKVCYGDKPSEQFISFSKCGHSFCTTCAKYVFQMNITESNTAIQCLRCSMEILPYEVKLIVDDQHFQKYLDFSLRRYLAHIPNARYCPAPNCTYAYILENVSGCDDGHFVCAREGCGKEFCYECKRPWHPEKSCQQAKAEVAIDMPEDVLPDDILNTLNTKQCPLCKATIEKMADGSCNQVHCVYCGIDFCWLCGKRITEMHYLRMPPIWPAAVVDKEALVLSCWNVVVITDFHPLNCTLSNTSDSHPHTYWGWIQGLLIHKKISEQEMPHCLNCGCRDCQSAVCSPDCADRCSCSHPTGMLLCVWNYTRTLVLDEYTLRVN